jgi:hypothetical protein
VKGREPGLDAVDQGGQAELELVAAAAGRDSARLGTLGADDTCSFAELVKAADVDVVVDYVWASPPPGPWSTCSPPAPTAARH